LQIKNEKQNKINNHNCCFNIRFFVFIQSIFVLFNELFSESNQTIARMIWNTAKIDIYFILGYFYIKYSKRSHAYFNFHDQKTG